MRTFWSMRYCSKFLGKAPPAVPAALPLGQPGHSVRSNGLAQGAACSPSPLPSPSGRGSITARLSKILDAPGWPIRCQSFSLSLRERAGVRGKTTSNGLRVPLDRNDLVGTVLLLLLLFVQAAIGADTNAPAPVFHSSVKAASDAAAADQSLVLVVFRADSSEPSKELKSRTLNSRELRVLDFSSLEGSLESARKTTSTSDWSAAAASLAALTLLWKTGAGALVSGRK